jgi:hypothetical protein
MMTTPPRTRRPIVARRIPTPLPLARVVTRLMRDVPGIRPLDMCRPGCSPDDRQPPRPRRGKRIAPHRNATLGRIGAPQPRAHQTGGPGGIIGIYSPHMRDSMVGSVGAGVALVKYRPPNFYILTNQNTRSTDRTGNGRPGVAAGRGSHLLSETRNRDAASFAGRARPGSARRRVSPGPAGPRAGFAAGPGRIVRRSAGLRVLIGTWEAVRVNPVRVDHSRSGSGHGRSGSGQVSGCFGPVRPAGVAVRFGPFRPSDPARGPSSVESGRHPGRALVDGIGSA